LNDNEHRQFEQKALHSRLELEIDEIRGALRAQKYHGPKKESIDNPTDQPWQPDGVHWIPMPSAAPFRGDEDNESEYDETMRLNQTPKLNVKTAGEGITTDPTINPQCAA
jgi:hypothetical protein